MINSRPLALEAGQVDWLHFRTCFCLFFNSSMAFFNRSIMHARDLKRSAGTSQKHLCRLQNARSFREFRRFGPYAVILLPRTPAFPVASGEISQLSCGIWRRHATFWSGLLGILRVYRVQRWRSHLRSRSTYSCYAASCYTVQHLHLVAAWRHWPSFSRHTCHLSTISTPNFSRGSPSSRRQFVIYNSQFVSVLPALCKDLLIFPAPLVTLFPLL